MKKLLAIALFFTTASAQAGSSATSLICSSESGKTVVAGLLPGQGEMATDLKLGIESEMMSYNSEFQKLKVIVDIAKNGARIRIFNEDNGNRLIINATSNIKIASSNNGEKGSFVGQLTGTNPKTGEMIAQAITVRCFVNNEI